MKIVKINPFRELYDFQNSIERFVGRAPFEQPAARSGGSTESSTWFPSVDIEEKDEAIVLVAELPGFERDQIQISVEDGRLTLSGERKFEKEERNYQRVERRYGRFSRSFSLSTAVDLQNIEATLKNGVLTVTLPRKEEAKPRQIEVKVA